VGAGAVFGQVFKGRELEGQTQRKTVDGRRWTVDGGRWTVAQHWGKAWHRYFSIRLNIQFILGLGAETHMPKART